MSLPLLNEALLPNISVNSAVGLTTDEPGSQPGEPDKYYPTGQRTFVRIAPRDTVQGAVLVELMKREGCDAAYVIDDKDTYGAGLARNMMQAAKPAGLNLIGQGSIEKTAANYRSLASSIAGRGADCVAFAGLTANNAVQLFKDLAVALPEAKLFGSDGVVEPAFTDPAEGGVPPEVGRRVQMVFAGLAPEEYPPAGQRFFRDYQSAYGESNPAPFAIYGYEEMALALDAIERAGEEGNDREAVRRELFATKDRESVLGNYDVEETGDTTSTVFGVYRIVDGQAENVGSVEAR